MASATSDAAYLCRMLDRQPACVVRVRLDGVLLACNDAALHLLGAASLGEILSTNLTERIIAAESAEWTFFAAQVWTNGAASLECHLAARDGERRPVVLQGIALHDHPDGLESVLLHLRDQSRAHRLARSIQSADVERAQQEMSEQAIVEKLKQAREERRQLAASVEEHRAARERLSEALDSEKADRAERQKRYDELERRIEESQLAQLVVQGQSRERISALEAELEAARAVLSRTAGSPDGQAIGAEQQQAALAQLELHLSHASAEQRRLAARIEEVERERDRLTAEHRHAIADLESSKGKALADVQLELSRAPAERRRLAARVEEVEGERDRASAEHDVVVAELESQTKALADVRLQLSQVSSEQRRLAVRVEAVEGERDRLSTEHGLVAADLKTQDEALAEVRLQLSQTLSQQRRLAARVEAGESERDRLIAEHRYAVADLEKSKSEAVAELRLQLSLTSAELSRLAARIDDDERQRDRMSGEHCREIAELEAANRESLAQLRLQLSQAWDEQRRLVALIEQHERERDRVIAEHHRTITALKISKTETVAELREQLAEAEAEERRLSARLEEQERERDRVNAEHRRTISHLEASKREAIAECERVLTDVQQALLVGDTFRLQLERRLMDHVDQAAREKASGERLLDLKPGLMRVVSEMQTVLADREPHQLELTAKDAAEGEKPEPIKDDAIVEIGTNGGQKAPAADAEENS